MDASSPGPMVFGMKTVAAPRQDGIGPITFTRTWRRHSRSISRPDLALGTDRPLAPLRGERSIFYSRSTPPLFGPSPHTSEPQKGIFSGKARRRNTPELTHPIKEFGWSLSL